MRFFKSFYKQMIIIQRLVFLHFNTEITITSKILCGRKIKKIIVDAKLIWEMFPYEVELLISEDMIEELLDH